MESKFLWPKTLHAGDTHQRLSIRVFLFNYTFTYNCSWVILLCCFIQSGHCEEKEASPKCQLLKIPTKQFLTLRAITIHLFLYLSTSLFQALCQCELLKKQAGDERGLVEKEEATPPSPFHSRIPLEADPACPAPARFFKWSSLTESLEQATCRRKQSICYVVQFNSTWRVARWQDWVQLGRERTQGTIARFAAAITVHMSTLTICFCCCCCCFFLRISTCFKISEGSLQS